MTKKIEKLLESYQLSKHSIIGVINPLEVVALFEKKQLDYILVGGHMLAYHTQNPRATVDVDFIVASKHFAQAVEIIQSHFPKLIYNDRTQHITFDKDNQKNAERIDLIKDEFPLFKKALKALHKTKEKIKIPMLEVAICLKFAACISPNRSIDDKLIDQADLINLIKVKSTLNTKILQSFAETVYLGGAKELLQVVDDVRNNRTIGL